MKRCVKRLPASRWRDQEVSAATELNNRVCEIHDRADFPRDLKKRIEHAPAILIMESSMPVTMQTPFEI